MNRETSKTFNIATSSKKTRRTSSSNQTRVVPSFTTSQVQGNLGDSIESMVQTSHAAGGSHHLSYPHRISEDHFMDQIGNSHSPPQPPSGFTWQQMDHSYPYPNPYRLQPGFVSETENYGQGIHPLLPLSVDTDVNTTRRNSLASAHSPSGSSSPDGQEYEAERNASFEDKRRRNTAASARFRMRKKQRILSLERALNDLKGRAKDLEGEAAELRKENEWLKDIAILKGVSATEIQTPDSVQADDRMKGTGRV